jgi:hypothetical protein
VKVILNPVLTCIGLCCSGPAQVSNVIILDTPHDDCSAPSSSSYDLSLFSLKVNSQSGEGATVASVRSLDMSVGDLWPRIDELDIVGSENPSAILTWGPRRDGAPPCRIGLREVVKVDSGSRRGPTLGHGRRSRNRAARVLGSANEAVSSQMRRSLIDGRYSPSIGMDWREWEIVLGEYKRMGLLVKHEPVSEGED